MNVGSDDSQSGFADQTVAVLKGILELGGSIAIGVSSRFAPLAQTPPGFALWQTTTVQMMSAIAAQFADHQRHLLLLVDPKRNPPIQTVLDNVDQLRIAGIALHGYAGGFQATPEQAATLLRAYTDVAFWSKQYFGQPLQHELYELFLTTLEPANWARRELLAANRPGGKKLSEERLREIITVIKPITHATLTVLAMTDILQTYLRQLGVVYQDDQH